MHTEQQSTEGVSTSGGTPAPAPKNMSAIIIGGIVVLAIGGYFLRDAFSGERMAERAIEQATGGAVDIDMNAGGESTVRVTDDDGSEFNYSTGGSVSLPSDWPEDVPIIEGATVTYVGTMDPQTGKAAQTVSLTSDKPVSGVATYYETELAANGWTITGTMNIQGTSMVTATKGEREAGVYVGGDTDVTTISITINW